MNKTDCLVRARMHSHHHGVRVNIYSRKKLHATKGTPRDYAFRDVGRASGARQLQALPVPHLVHEIAVVRDARYCRAQSSKGAR